MGRLNLALSSLAERGQFAVSRPTAYADSNAPPPLDASATAETAKTEDPTRDDFAAQEEAKSNDTDNNPDPPSDANHEVDLSVEWESIPVAPVPAQREVGRATEHGEESDTPVAELEPFSEFVTTQAGYETPFEANASDDVRSAPASLFEPITTHDELLSSAPDPPAESAQTQLEQGAECHAERDFDRDAVQIDDSPTVLGVFPSHEHSCPDSSVDTDEAALSSNEVARMLDPPTTPFEESVATSLGDPANDLADAKEEFEPDLVAAADLVENEDDRVVATLRHETEKVSALVEEVLGVPPAVRVRSFDDDLESLSVEEVEQGLDEVEADVELWTEGESTESGGETNGEVSEGELRPETETPSAPAAYCPVIQPWALLRPEQEVLQDREDPEDGVDSNSQLLVPETDWTEERTVRHEADQVAPSEDDLPPSNDSDAASNASSLDGIRPEFVVVSEPRPEPEPELEVKPGSEREPVLPNSVEPTAYEVAIAEKLLRSDFGARIEDLYAQLQSHLEGDGGHIVLMLSLDVDDQRADATCALGMFACAHQADETLIVDADVDSRFVSTGFEKFDAGLLEDLPSGGGWSQFVQPTSCERLRILPCGTTRNAIPHHADPESVRDLVQQWKNRFSLILVDCGVSSSPLGLSLVPFADATYICVQLGKDRKQELLAAAEQIEQIGGSVTGCITTGATS